VFPDCAARHRWRLPQPIYQLAQQRALITELAAWLAPADAVSCDGHDWWLVEDGGSMLVKECLHCAAWIVDAT